MANPLTFLVCFGAMWALMRYFEALGAALSWAGGLLCALFLARALASWLGSFLPRWKINSAGKAVLITGCDTGFGNSLAQRLYSQGYTVFAGCLSENSEGARELRELCASNLHVVSLDVTKYDQVQVAVKEVQSKLGEKELWAVVNNAGVAIFSELEWCSMSVIEHMFNVNVLGAVRVTKAFLPLLRKAKGRVVVVASVAGHVTYPGFVSYSMTKHSLVSLADGLRREMRKWGVSVTTIEPSMYKTHIARSDVLTGALDKSWDKTPEPIKLDYGFPYYEDFRHRMQKLAMKARPYLEEVVGCMEEAVTELRPQISYRCAGPADKIRLWVMSLLPVSLQDLLICLIVQPSHRQLSGNGKTK